MFSSTGHRHTNAIRNTLPVLPTPSTTTANGSSAGGGIARRNSTIGDVARRSSGESPSGIPIATATTHAIT